MNDESREPGPGTPPSPAPDAPESMPAAPADDAGVHDESAPAIEKEIRPTAAAPAEAPAEPPAAAPIAARSRPTPRRSWGDRIREPDEIPIEIPRRRLAAQTRRDFLLFTAATAAAALGAWWLLPDRTRMRLLPGAAHDRLDTLAARVGLTRDARDRTLNRALTFDDDVAEALYSKQRRVRTYDRSQVTALRNNYNGRTPGPEYLPGWSLALAGLASGTIEHLTAADLIGRFPRREQVTRLICVEGWSAVAWWGGIRFADLLDAFPPAPGARWAALASAVNLDSAGRPDPYYVSIDLETARHPQTLLATHQGGRPLTLGHGAPLRLVAPMKLGLKNIKAVTSITYQATEPRDYWNEQGYSRYDGL